MTTPYARELADGVELLIHAQPRAAKSRVVGPFDGQLKVQLAAPPVDGEANAELVRFLAKALGVPQRRVELVAGETSRRKRVRVHGVTLAAAVAALG